MSAALSLNRSFVPKTPSPSPAIAGPRRTAIARHVSHRASASAAAAAAQGQRRCAAAAAVRPRRCRAKLRPAASRSDDSPSPFEMSVEGAMNLLGVSEGSSFDEVLRAKKAIIASCKEDHETVAKVEAAYDMLLMDSLTQRRSGKVVNSSIRYADVKPVSSGKGALPQWLQATVKNVPVSVEAPPSRNLGIQAGVYGALMVSTFVSGSSTSAGAYTGADVPGIILATGFGASLYFLTKKSIGLGFRWSKCSSGGRGVGLRCILWQCEYV